MPGDAQDEAASVSKTIPRRPRKKPAGAPNKNPGTGRRSRLVTEPDLAGKIATMVATGMSFKDAARANGVSESAFHAWRQRGEHAKLEQEKRAKLPKAALVAEAKLRELSTAGTKQKILERLAQDEAPYVELVEAVQKAEAERRFVWLERIDRAAGDGDWKASAWLLERTYPAEYSRRTISELVGKDGGPIQTETHEITEDVRETMQEKFEEIKARKAERPLALVRDDDEDTPPSKQEVAR